MKIYRCDSCLKETPYLINTNRAELCPDCYHEGVTCVVCGERARIPHVLVDKGEQLIVCRTCYFQAFQTDSRA